MLEDPAAIKMEEHCEDVYIPELFDCNSALIYKMNDFAYFSDFFFSRPHHNMHDMSIFDINSTKVEAFNLGRSENPRNISIASEVAPEERKKLEEILKKYAKVFVWSCEDMQGVDRGIAQHVIPTYPR